MNLAFYISKRYLIAKKSHNAINIITAISVGLVAIGTIALIAIMSVFNGLETLVGSLSTSINSDLLIEPKTSKYIDRKDFPEEKIKKLEGIKYWSPTLGDNVLFKYKPALETISREYIGYLLGVEENYTKSTNIESMMIDGVFLLQNYGKPYCVMGNGVAANLQIHLNDFDNPIRCYFPKADASVNINPMDAISIGNLLPSGVFSIQQEIDEKLIIAPLNFVQELMNLKGKLTSIQVELEDESEVDNIQKEIQNIVGNSFTVKNKIQQNDVMYNIMKSEKWSSFLILAFILFIATFNLVGALSVLIIDKQADIQILTFMGANKTLISKIFLFEGFMVTMSGTLIGLVLGALLVVIQDTFGIIPMQGSFAVDSFPVELLFSDLAAVFAVVIVVSLIAVIYPIRRLSNTILLDNTIK
ncbi:MAG: hypothetical protein DRI86_03395 [Bacteroidetes bacterium]|nr:MAG: hypothetical protein DRI86_03395 [Bacteroidota bacterium]